MLNQDKLAPALRAALLRIPETRWQQTGVVTYECAHGLVSYRLTSGEITGHFRHNRCFVTVPLDEEMRAYYGRVADHITRQFLDSLEHTYHSVASGAGR